jgi:Gluconate 2-dehydrogenase subunit 3
MNAPNGPRAARYPGYNVLDKRDTPSWDDATRQVIDERLATPDVARFCSEAEWQTLSALCAAIVPQTGRHAHERGDGGSERSPQAGLTVPLAAIVDEKLAANRGDGYRDARLPPLREAWRIGLAALDAESRARFRAAFGSIDEPSRISLIDQMQRGELSDPAWHRMPCALFFTERVLHDICGAYYSHPRAWNEIGFGGPANPRGYVRMFFDRRDPWEASEARPGREARARRENARAR